jgi:hypothetical protein
MLFALSGSLGGRYCLPPLTAPLVSSRAMKFRQRFCPWPTAARHRHRTHRPPSAFPAAELGQVLSYADASTATPTHPGLRRCPFGCIGRFGETLAQEGIVHSQASHHIARPQHIVGPPLSGPPRLRPRGDTAPRSRGLGTRLGQGRAGHLTGCATRHRLSQPAGSWLKKRTQCATSPCGSGSTPNSSRVGGNRKCGSMAVVCGVIQADGLRTCDSKALRFG